MAVAGIRARTDAPAGIRLRLFGLSFLMLFVELFLIRWTAAYILYLAYFTNFILLASFLGIGLGFLRARNEVDRSGWTAVALAGMVAFVMLFPAQVSRLAAERSVVGLFGIPALPVWIELPVLFLGATLVMALLAEGVARAFVRLEPLDAYRTDILGSLAGVIAFAGLSAFGARPLALGAVIAALVWGLLVRVRLQRVAAGLVLLLLIGGSVAPHDAWSPYYRVTVGNPSTDGLISVKVNGLPHQTMVPLAQLAEAGAFYFFPYERLKRDQPGDVLIVGAGTGN